jgi:NAD(P)-dependent dehydrogenase (short-subunit alcohol dehydrogenase family)
MSWTVKDMPDQKGRVVAITGANSGLGFEGAKGFASRGARVIMACRNVGKGEDARRRIVAEHPRATVEVMALDLASLASVRRFAEDLVTQVDRLDVLCNNAGVMALPRTQTADGFEMQFGTNHLGHFALTGRLLPLLRATANARIVTMSSGAHRMGRIDFDDLQGSAGYGKWTAYAQSKLANLLFVFELDRRLRMKQARMMSVACHPGYSATELQAAGPKMEGSAFMERIMELGNRLLAQDAATGALPMLYAATASDVEGGDYIGPDGIGELWGHPTKVQPTARARDPETAARLWATSEELTGVRYDALDG